MKLEDKKDFLRKLHLTFTYLTDDQLAEQLNGEDWYMTKNRIGKYCFIQIYFNVAKSEVYEFMQVQ